MSPSKRSTRNRSGTNSSHSTTLIGNVHLRQRHLHVPFLQERRAGVEVDERDEVGPVRPEARPQQRHAAAVLAFDRLRRRPGHFHRQHRRTRRQRDLHERLRAVAHPHRHFGQRAPFGREQRRRDGALGDGGEDLGVGESGGRRGSAPAGRRRYADSGTPRAAPAAPRRRARDRLRARPCGGGPGSPATSTSSVPRPSIGDFPVSRCAAGIVGKPVSSLNEPPRVRPLEAEQELVPPERGIGDEQHDRARLRLGAIERRAADARRPRSRAGA